MKKHTVQVVLNTFVPDPTQNPQEGIDFGALGLTWAWKGKNRFNVCTSCGNRTNMVVNMQIGMKVVGTIEYCQHCHQFISNVDKVAFNGEIDDLTGVYHQYAELAMQIIPNWYDCVKNHEVWI
jgi:hypothetical protein